MRERPGCLTEHHDHEGGRDGRKHESRHRVDHLQLGKHPEQRDHDRCKRNHHSCQQNSKYDIFSFVMVDLKTVTGQRTDQQADQSQYGRIPEGIPERTGKILIRDQCLKVLYKISTRDQFSSGYIHALVCSRTRHIIQRENREQRTNGQESIHCYFFAFIHRSSPTFI